jgi:hypothetical protein
MAKKKALPPDPDGINDKRAEWARRAVATFQRETGVEAALAVGDLLANLMHLTDREPERYGTFKRNMRRAKDHYADETYEIEIEEATG